MMFPNAIPVLKVFSQKNFTFVNNNKIVKYANQAVITYVKIEEWWISDIYRSMVKSVMNKIKQLITCKQLKQLYASKLAFPECKFILAADQLVANAESADIADIVANILK